jgi:TPR repeat protein
VAWTEEDPELSERYLRQAAQFGLPNAAHALAVLLRDRNPRESETFLRIAADGGHSGAKELLKGRKRRFR